VASKKEIPWNTIIALEKSIQLRRESSFTFRTSNRHQSPEDDSKHDNFVSFLCVVHGLLVVAAFGQRGEVDYGVWTRARCCRLE
jgi:hypothetical protein